MYKRQDPDYATYGNGSVSYYLNGANLEKYNRIAFSIYPDCDGTRVVNMNLTFVNANTPVKRGYNQPSGSHLINLVNKKWNQCFLEIDEYQRDKVMEISFSTASKGKDVYKRQGVFNKPHGIHGELSFTFTDDIFDRVEAEYLICLLDGILVPFFLEDYRFRSDTTALVKLEGVNTAERARMFTNVEVYFPTKHAGEVEPAELSWDFFVGFRIDVYKRQLLYRSDNSRTN